MNRLGGVAKYNQLQNIRPVVIAMMTNEGRITDSSVCEICLELIPDNHYEIHHTKYEGATYYDLQVICQSCNRLEVNCYLV